MYLCEASLLSVDAAVFMSLENLSNAFLLAFSFRFSSVKKKVSSKNHFGDAKST